jgi:hypothetical protein
LGWLHVYDHTHNLQPLDSQQISGVTEFGEFALSAGEFPEGHGF